jgi:hypothetical protein
MSEAIEAEAPVEPPVYFPTDLSFFGKPGVTLVPKKITSVNKKDRGGLPLWRGDLEVGCAGVEVVVTFEKKDAWEACYDWLKRCIIANQN